MFLSVVYWIVLHMNIHYNYSCVCFLITMQCKYNTQQLLLISVFKFCIHSILYITFWVYCDNFAYMRHWCCLSLGQFKSFSCCLDCITNWLLGVFWCFFCLCSLFFDNTLYVSAYNSYLFSFFLCMVTFVCPLNRVSQSLFTFCLVLNLQCQSFMLDSVVYKFLTLFVLFINTSTLYIFCYIANSHWWYIIAIPGVSINKQSEN